MILLVPLWPKEKLRLPLATMTLLAICLLTFFSTWPAQSQRVGSGSRDDLIQASRKLVTILLDPSSPLTAEDRHLLESDWSSNDFPSQRTLEYLQSVKAGAAAPLPSRLQYEWDLAYPLFEGLAKVPSSRQEAAPFNRWGFNPDRPWFPGLFTYLFLHAGWLHLLFNLLFLWIAGSVSEDFAGVHVLWIFLAGGIAGALAQTLVGIPAGQNLVGASAGIAALMGFALFARPKAQVKLFYFVLLIIIPKYGAFDCPLWFFLPIWLLMQILLSQLATHTGTVGTAYAAHLAGFALGSFVGLNFRKK